MAFLRRVLLCIAISACLTYSTNATATSPEEEERLLQELEKSQNCEQAGSCKAGFFNLNSFYSAMPTNGLSRLFTSTASGSLSKRLLRTYAKATHCNLTEMELPLDHYPTLAEFFKRRLKPGLRPVSQESVLVWPSDSRVTAFGEMKPGGVMEQIKGVSYSMSGFFGPETSRRFFEQSRPGYKLYYAVLYLAPGDYHHFHSPADWSITTRIHIAGKLMSVNPAVVKKIPGLFVQNERVALIGTWKPLGPQGQPLRFSMTAVAAQNVGGVVLDFDPNLKTNSGAAANTISAKEYGEDRVQMKRGDHMGGFEFGSTIVLVFEAPEGFVWKSPIDNHGLYGQDLGHFF